MYNAITDVEGIKVGHASDHTAMTGCTVVLCENGAVAGVDVRGSAPGTRETDLLRPTNLVEKVHGILLTGGSAFGLDAASGVIKYLYEKNIGYDTGDARVPIVPAAVIYDLGVGNSHIWPDALMGYNACINATSGMVEQGSVGAGTGATVGKIMGVERSTKSGVGTASIVTASFTIGAIMVVNALGDIYDGDKIIAGVKGDNGYINTVNYLTNQHFKGVENKNGSDYSMKNTTIGVVATDIQLTKEQANKLASIAHDGLALAIRPVHTMADGDTLFAISTGSRKVQIEKNGVDFLALCTAAVEVVRRSIINAVKRWEL